METTVPKTWKPVTAGILNIITVALNVFGALAFIITIVAFNTSESFLDYVPAEDLPFVVSVANIVLITLLVLSIIEAVFPIIGGVFALQRRKWGWVLAGSIIAILGILPLGVASTIFVVMGRDEFE